MSKMKTFIMYIYKLLLTLIKNLAHSFWMSCIAWLSNDSWSWKSWNT